MRQGFTATSCASAGSGRRAIEARIAMPQCESASTYARQTERNDYVVHTRSWGLSQSRRRRPEGVSRLRSD